MARNQAGSGLRAIEVGLDKILPWQYREVGGFDRFVRWDAEKERETFFSCIGVRVENTQGREVKNGWTQVLLVDHGYPGAIVVFKVKQRGRWFYLVRAKAEPGSTGLGGISVTTSIQASGDNSGRVHGGGVPARNELLNRLVEAGQSPVDSALVRMDPGRFLNKFVWVRMFEVSVADLGVITPDERLCTRQELAEMIREGVGNEFLSLAAGVIFV